MHYSVHEEERGLPYHPYLTVSRVLQAGLTSMHSSKHAGDELVYAETLLDQRDQCGDATFVVGRTSEVGENELLKGFDLIL